jgi:uncharacterized membrane protein (UPF0182 family)
MPNVLERAGRSWIGVTALFTLVTPLVADWNETHIYNPAWPPHAKFHNAQTMIMGVLLGALSLYFLLTSGRDRLRVRVAALLAGLYWAALAPSILVPGTAFVDPEFGGYRPLYLGPIPFNQSVLSLVVLGLLVAATAAVLRGSPGVPAALGTGATAGLGSAG